MARNITEIQNDWIKIQKDLLDLANNGAENIDQVRKSVRERIITNQAIDNQNELEVLLKKEYDLEREQREINLKAEMITKGKNVKSPEFQYELNKRMIQADMEMMGYSKNELDNERKTIQQKVILGEDISSLDAKGHLLAKEYMQDRELFRISLEENLSQRLEKGTKAFQNTVEFRILLDDRLKLDFDTFNRYETEFKQKKQNNEEIDLNNGYFRFLQKESDLNEKMAADIIEANQKKEQEKLQQAELNKKVVEEAKKEAEVIAEAAKEVVNEIVEEKPSKNPFSRFFGLFRRTPKKAPVVTEPEKTEVKVEKKEEEPAKEQLAEEEKRKQEEELKKKLLEEEEKEREEKKKRAEEKRREERKRREEEKKRRLDAEFAGKDLDIKIQGCSDPKILSQYLEDAALIKKPKVKEHLQSRLLANATIQSYENSRSILTKSRPPAVKYKDGTILLKNKNKDVEKQSSMNGCWSSVLSDMLGHFGVNLSQEDIRAYRPDLSVDMNNNDAKKLMERLNSDAMNEINDMADLIQRTVPNVAHHHMTLGASKEENKAVLKEKVTDALLNKNSPVALLYGNHYLSVVGIKGETLIVQNPDPRYDTKYQKLSINDLFEGCKDEKGEGSVVIDWLEDLKFNKDGTCKNVTEQWKNMGIECNQRQFKAGADKNEFTHVRGNQYYDTSRIDDLIEETIYLPKMSYGREKELAAVEITKQQLDNVEKGIITFEEMHKQQQEMLLNHTDTRESVSNEEPDLTIH